MIAAEASGGKMSDTASRGLLVAGGIVVFGTVLGLIAFAGKPSALRRPDPPGRPVLLVPDFDDRTGRGELVGFARQLSEAVRERLGGDPEGIFEISPRRLRPVLSPREREDGLLRIGARLGADYVLVGSLESGPGQPLAPGSSWVPLSSVRGSGESETAETVRLDVLLVHDAARPHVFAERFPLGSPPDEAGQRRRLARTIADRIALSLRRPSG